MPGLTAFRQYFDFVEALRNLLGREIDLVSGQIRNPYLRSSVDADKELIFEAELEGLSL